MYDANELKHLPMSTLLDLWERAGYVFEASAQITLPSNGNSDTLFTTGQRPVVLFSREVSYDGEGFNAFIYRDPTYTGGTPITEINNANDVNPQTKQVNILTGATVSNVGVLSRSPRYIFGNTSNQGQGNALEVIQSPQIIPPNSTLLLRFTNRDTNSTQLIASHLRWAEPPQIQDYIITDGAFVDYKGLIS